MLTPHTIKLDSQHRYFAGEDRIPGFTEICKSLGVIEDNNFYTAAGREEGSALSEWALFLAQGMTPSEAPDPRIAGRVAGIVKFMSESGFKFSGGELPLFDPDARFAATPDIWGHIGGVSWVIDVKRGTKQKWHPLQTAAQAIALRANGFKVQKRGNLYLKDGGYRLDEHTDPSDESRWKILVQAYHAKTFYGGGYDH